MNPTLACFVSPHGFGHAARTSAVLAALRARLPNLHSHIYTTAPQWFFREALGEGFTYHHYNVDVGLVQRSPLEEDLPATLEKLHSLYPPPAQTVSALADEIGGLQVSCILSDIAPLGLTVARALNIPGILLENFTWDWIYEGYLTQAPQFANYIQILRQQFAQAEYHLQTEPLCQPNPRATLHLPPISRPPRTAPTVLRAQLGLRDHLPVALVSLGGVQGGLDFLPRLAEHPECQFIVPGGAQSYRREKNLWLLAHHSEWYHPDLLHASDLVIGKLGYSTIAEVYAAGVPFGFVVRPDFRESAPLRQFVLQNIPSLELPAEGFARGEWINLLPQLLTLPKRKTNVINGAHLAADFLFNHFFKPKE